MLIYYILIFVPMLIPLARSKGVIRIGDKTTDQRNVVIVTFFSIYMTMLMMRGMDCGADTAIYHRHFETINRYNIRDLIALGITDLGHILLAKLVGFITTDSQIYIAVTAVLAVLPLLLFYRREAEIPLLTYLLFATVAPFSMYFSGVRQTLAMAFVVPAWYLAKSKTPIKFLLCVVAATLFHKSAFIIAVIYPLYHVRITFKWLVVVLPVMAVVYVFNDRIFNFLTQFLWEDYGSAGSTGATTVLLLLLIFAAYSFFVPDEKIMDDDVIAYRNLLLFAIILQCFAPLHPLAMRMNYYFLLFVPLLIPKIANRSSSCNWRIRNISVLVMTVFFAVYFFYRAYADEDTLLLFPYIPFWES